MKTTIERLPKSIVEVIADFDKKEWSAAQEKAINKLVKEVTVKGFRKGKAPVETARKYLGQDKVFNEAINHIIQDNLKAVLDEHDLNPMVQPSVDVLKVTEDLLQIKYIITVAPSVEVGPYTNLAIGHNKVSVSAKEVDAKLVELQTANAELTIKEGPSLLGDTVVIDFEGFVDGKAFEGGKAENFDLELGSGQFIPGFEDQLVGKNAGEKVEVNVTFPENYVEALKGQQAMFKVTVHEVKGKSLPELNDEFAKTINKNDAQTLVELKKVVKEELSVEKDNNEKTRYLNLLLQEIAKTSKIEVADSVIKQEADNMKKNLIQQIEQQGLNLEQYLQLTNGTEAALDEKFSVDAKLNLDSYLIVTEVGKREKFEVSEAELNEELEKMSKQYNMEVDKIKEILGESLSNLTSDIRQRKTIDFLIKNNN